MDKYLIINNGVLAVCAVLFVLFLIIVIRDALKPMPCDPDIRYKQAPKVKLELMYPSTLKDTTLHMPVRHVLHAQEMVDLMGLEEGYVGYRRSKDGFAIVLYELDANRTLRRVKEVV